MVILVLINLVFNWTLHFLTLSCCVTSDNRSPRSYRAVSDDRSNVPTLSRSDPHSPVDEGTDCRSVITLVHALSRFFKWTLGNEKHRWGESRDRFKDDSCRCQSTCQTRWLQIRFELANSRAVLVSAEKEQAQFCRSFLFSFKYHKTPRSKFVQSQNSCETVCLHKETVASREPCHLLRTLVVGRPFVCPFHLGKCQILCDCLSTVLLLMIIQYVFQPFHVWNSVTWLLLV